MFIFEVIMARKTQITKEIILQSALEILIEKGFSEVNIKTISKKIGCSTQPIVWHFNNMNGFRIALGQHALAYANKKLCPKISDTNDAFYQVGNAYINLALEEPNLFQFLYMSGNSNLSLQNFNGLLKDDGNSELIKILSAKLQISEEKAALYLQNTIIYTHGIATLIVAGIIKPTKKEIFDYIKIASKSFLENVRV